MIITNPLRSARPSAAFGGRLTFRFAAYGQIGWDKEEDVGNIVDEATGNKIT